MGVLGLWQLLAPVGQPVTLESLENKIFAVDISIWLNQALKGYRDSQGGSVPNAHLLSLFSRLCKLLFYKIRPIIVFDGGYPELKRQTIINRQQRRAAIKQSSRDVGLKVLANYLASQNLAKDIGTVTSSQISTRSKEKVRDEIFKLPPLPDTSLDGGYETSESELIEWKFTNFTKEDIKYLNKIDIDSEDFNSLPPDVKQEILSTLKESRRHKTWEQYEELPEESNEFSNYQMQCLLKKRNLQKKLEQVQKDLRQINSADFIAQYTNDHVIGETNKIMSDDCSHYVLLRKIIHKNDSKDKSFDETSQSSSMVDTKNAFIKDMENIDVSEIVECNTVKNKNSSNEILDQNQVEIKLEFDFFDKLDEEDVDDPDKIHYLERTQNSSVNTSLSSETSTRKNESINSSSDDEGECSSSQLQNNNTCETNCDGHVSTSTSKQIDVPPELVEKLDYSKSIVHINFVKNVDLTNENKTISFSDDEMISCDEAEESFVKENIILEEEIIDNLRESTNDLTKIVSTQDLTNESSCDKTSIEVITTSKLENSISNKNDVSEESSSQRIKSVPFHQIPSTSRSDCSTEADAIAARKQLQEDLDSVAMQLEADQAKQDRQNRTVQEHMVEECKELLQLFGIPYVVSPTEAEAQCAFYDLANLTHGTITDDSDVWLFGGKRVYKNFFTQQKYVEFYKDNEIFTHFTLSRKKLINFAMLTGSDYTEGIEGVGPVTAMEILSEFPGEDINALQRFKEWWLNANKNVRSPENKVRAKLLKLELTHNFPDEKVCDAYLNPVIDESTEKFSWGRPDLDTLRDYTKERFGWSKSKVDDALLPVIKKLNERESQTHLDSFFAVNLKKQTELFPSKRIMSALKKMSSPQKDNCKDEPEVKKAKRKITLAKQKSSKNVKRKTVGNAQKCTTKVKQRGPVLSEESSDD